MKSDQHNTILIVGASRGLGHAMATTFLQHGWEVIGTVRDFIIPHAAPRPGQDASPAATPGDARHPR